MAIVTRHSVLGFLCGILTLLLLEAGAAWYMVSLNVQDTSTAKLTTPAVPSSVTLGNMIGGFTDLDGHPVRYQDLQGKVVLINHWATWCAPCRAEMPSLDRLWKIFSADEGVAVYCISDEAPEDLRTHPITRELGMPLYVFSEGVPKELTTKGIPTTFVFDRSGRLVFTHTGMAEWDADRVVDYLQGLRGEGPGLRE